MRRLLLILVLGLILTACAEETPDMEGIVLESKDGQFLLAENLSQSAYEEIEDIEPTILHNETVAGDRDLDLIYLSYEAAEEVLESGDRVAVWLGGDIMTTFPAQAKAKKVKVK